MSKRFSILLVVLTIISGLILCGCASYYAGWTAPYAMINKLQRNMTEQGNASNKWIMLTDCIKIIKRLSLYAPTSIPSNLH